MSSLPQTNKEWLELDRQYRLWDPAFTAPMVLEHGEGIYVWDVEGNRYIDLQAGQLCVSTGHTHPKYVEAVSEQAKKLIQTGTPFTNPAQVLLAKKIAELTPNPLQKTYFACTGSESNEVALRLAKIYTCRYEIVALMRGYHGQTYGSYSITSFGSFSRGGYGPPVPGAVFFPSPYSYRCPFCAESGACNLGCADYGEMMLDQTTSGEPAAFFIELIQSAGGVIVPSVEWVRRIKGICEERGALLVADEALTGFGRSGKWFAFEHFGIVPDVLTTSKGLGGGVPLCAVTTSAEIADGAIAKGHASASSHSGDPLLCAAGLANIEIIERENLVENAHVVGAYLKSGLEKLKEKYEIIGDVRGLGLCLGIELVTDRKSKEPFFAGTAALTDYCRAHRMWLALRRSCMRETTGTERVLRQSSAHILRIMPALTITKEQGDEALEILEGGVKAALAVRPKQTRGCGVAAELSGGCHTPRITISHHSLGSAGQQEGRGSGPYVTLENVEGKVSERLMGIKTTFKESFVIVSPPRCSSTAMARVFWEHPSMHGYVHEPFERTYYRGGTVQQALNIFDNPVEIRKSGTNVVIKEMTFQIGVHFPLLASLTDRPIVFMIRDPRLNIWSRMKKLIESHQDPLFPEVEAGWYDLSHQVQYCQNRGVSYTIIDSTAFRNHPRTVLPKLFRLLDLEFFPLLLSWRIKKEPSEIANFGEEQRHWYGKVLESTGIEPATEIVPDIAQFPEALQPHLRECIAIYHRLLEDPHLLST